MRARIKKQFENLLQEEYPEMILLFSEKGTLSQYLEDRITWIEPVIDELMQEVIEDEEIITLCMKELTSGFGPSKYRYLLTVLEEEYPADYQRFKTAGVLKFEVTNLIVTCTAAFDAFEFSAETMDNTFLRHMIIAEIHDYLLSRQAK